jgi:hypothetical protein
MESDYHELVVKTEYLKASKQKIKKDIEFYKAVISKVVITMRFRPLSTMPMSNDSP